MARIGSGLRLLLAAAALSGLTACDEGGMRPSTNLVVADSADQVIFRMSTRVFDEALLRSHVVAETAYVYQGRQQMDLRQLRVTFYDDQGKQSSVLTARQGMYTITTGSLDARGDVAVQTTDGRRLTTPHLVYDKTAMQLRSDTSFVYLSPTGTLRGISFQSDLDFRNVIVNRPQGRQVGEGILLPGQDR